VASAAVARCLIRRARGDSTGLYPLKAVFCLPAVLSGVARAAALSEPLVLEMHRLQTLGAASLSNWHSSHGVYG
jgi:hypothetical protein